MPVVISARTLPFSDKASVLYSCLMSLGNTHVGINMYSYCCSLSISVMRKKFDKSMVKNFVPSVEMILAVMRSDVGV